MLEKTEYSDSSQYFLAVDKIGCRIVSLRVGYIVVDSVSIVGSLGIGFPKWEMVNIEKRFCWADCVFGYNRLFWICHENPFKMDLDKLEMELERI